MTSYRIRLKEQLGSRWQTFFPLSLNTVEIEGQTLSELRGPLDPAALHGTLQTIRDLNLHLLSVSTEEADPENAADHTTFSLDDKVASAATDKATLK